MKMLKNEKGFTLIELVLVIMVLGILAAVATVQFGQLVQDSKDASVTGIAAVTNAQLAVAIAKNKALPTGGAAGTFKVDVHDNIATTGKFSISAYDGALDRFAVCSLSGAGPCTIGGTIAAPTAAACGSTSDRFVQVSYTPATGALAFSNPASCAS